MNLVIPGVFKKKQSPIDIAEWFNSHEGLYVETSRLSDESLYNGRSKSCLDAKLRSMFCPTDSVGQSRYSIGFPQEFESCCSRQRIR